MLHFLSIQEWCQYRKSGHAGGGEAGGPILLASVYNHVPWRALCDTYHRVRVWVPPSVFWLGTGYCAVSRCMPAHTHSDAFLYIVSKWMPSKSKAKVSEATCFPLAHTPTKQAWCVKQNGNAVSQHLFHFAPFPPFLLDLSFILPFVKVSLRRKGPAVEGLAPPYVTLRTLPMPIWEKKKPKTKQRKC